MNTGVERKDGNDDDHDDDDDDEDDDDDDDDHLPSREGSTIAAVLTP